MQYLEKLLDRFSDTPQNIIVHADVLRRGVKTTDDLHKAGTQACITGLTNRLVETIFEQHPTPSQFHFRADNTTVDIKIDETSPYEIKLKETGKYHLFCGQQDLGEVWFTERPTYMDKKTSDGQDCANLLLQRGPHCLLVSPLDFCAYLKKGQACQYCLLSVAFDFAVKKKMVPAIPDTDMVAEAVEIACQDIHLKDLKICGGALYDTKKEADCYMNSIEAILDRIPMPEELTVFSQAFGRDDQKRLKAIGVNNVIFNMEVWNEEFWPTLLPGKHRAVGRKEWIKRLEAAVEVFGRGHVGTSFVAGFECAPRYGFLSREAALKSYVAAFEFFIERGIVPGFTVWTAMPIVGGFAETDPPPTEFYLELGAALHELLEKYGAYRDLGFKRMGEDPPTLGLYCYFCYSMQFARDYPRLVGRKHTDKQAA